jgi:hypothetical protein
MCVCKATHLAFNPFSRAGANEKEICEYTTRLKQLCSDPEHFLKYVFPDRCYCEKTRTYLTRALIPSFYFTHGRSPALFTEEKDWNGVQVKIEKCRQQSRALQAFEQGSPSAAETPLKELLKTLPGSILDRDPGAKTVKIAGARTGDHGGRRFIIIKRSPRVPWHDHHDYPNEQADPRFGSQVLGPILGGFLGYQILNEHEVTIPDLIEIHLGVEALNQRLSLGDSSWNHPWGNLNTPIKIQFYSADGVVLPRLYLSRFANDAQFPVALFPESSDDQTSFMHDATYHVTGLILTPPPVIEWARAQVRALFEFERYFRQQNPSESKRLMFQSVFSKIFTARALQIDSGSAQVLGTLARKSFHLDALSPTEFRRGILFYFLGGLTEEETDHDLSIHSTLNYLHTAEALFIDDSDRKVWKDTLNAFLQSKHGDPAFNAAFPIASQLPREQLDEDLRAYYDRWKSFLELHSQRVTD